MSIHSATLEQAADAFLRGEPVVFPTDTVYGVGLCTRAVDNLNPLYSLKGRREKKPIAWLVASRDDLLRYGEAVPSYADLLAQNFWPGSLTLVVGASNAVDTAFRSQGSTIGLRMPNRTTTLDLICAVASPIATTSANFSGAVAPRAFKDIDPKFLAGISCVVRDDTSDDDGNNAPSGVASTIIDCTGDVPRLIREGDLPFSQICTLMQREGLSV